MKPKPPRDRGTLLEGQAAMEQKLKTHSRKSTPSTEMHNTGKFLAEILREN